MPAAPQGQPLGLNPFGPLPVPSAAAAAAAATATASGASAAQQAPGVGLGQQYAGASSTSSLDGSCSVGGQWPAGEASSSGGGRSGCPVYVMLPLDTVWVVEREGQKVSQLQKKPLLLLQPSRAASCVQCCCACSLLQ